MNELDEEEKVVLSKDDMSNIEGFYKHFEEKMPDYMAKEIEFFKANEDTFTIADQKRFRAAVAKAMMEFKHKIMENPVWQGIYGNCDEEQFNAQFDEDLENALREED